MATGINNLPHPGKVYSPFDILTAEELNEDVANIESLASGSGIGDDAVTTAKIDDGAVTPAKRSGGFKVGRISPNGTGPLSVTGLGFTPKVLIFNLLSVSSSTVNYTGWGATDGTVQHATATYDEQGADCSGASSTSLCILAVTTNGITVVGGAFTSFDPDGFTLNITTRTASRTFAYEAYA